jgi:hypothetical protein
MNQILQRDPYEEFLRNSGLGLIPPSPAVTAVSPQAMAQARANYDAAMATFRRAPQLQAPGPVGNPRVIPVRATPNVMTDEEIWRESRTLLDALELACTADAGADVIVFENPLTGRVCDTALLETFRSRLPELTANTERMTAQARENLRQSHESLVLLVQAYNQNLEQATQRHSDETSVHNQVQNYLDGLQADEWQYSDQLAQRMLQVQATVRDQVRREAARQAEARTRNDNIRFSIEQGQSDMRAIVIAAERNLRGQDLLVARYYFQLTSGVLMTDRDRMQGLREVLGERAFRNLTDLYGPNLEPRF